QPGRMDALLLRDPRRTRADGAAGRRGPSLRRRPPRGMAPHFGDPRGVHRPGGREGTRRLPRGARAPAHGALAMKERSKRLSELLPDARIDVMMVTDIVNVRYLTGYTGSNGLALIGPQTRTFITDFRYVEQAAEEVHPSFERRRAPLDLLEA